MPSRQAASTVPFTLLPVKAIWEVLEFPLPTTPQKSLPRTTSGLSNSPWTGQGVGEGKRRGEGNSPSGFKLKLEVLGIEVMDADVAVLTPAAVAAGRKRRVRNAAGSKEWEVWAPHPLLKLR